jgi:hypothetical protein
MKVEEFSNVVPSLLCTSYNKIIVHNIDIRNQQQKKEKKRS